MITDYKITEIFYFVDEYCKEFDKQTSKHDYRGYCIEKAKPLYCFSIYRDFEWVVKDVKVSIATFLIGNHLPPT